MAETAARIELIDHAESVAVPVSGADARNGRREQPDDRERVAKKPKSSLSRSSQRAEGDANASQSTRERILDGAELLFAQQGYEGTTTRAISVKASVPLGLMSYYFGTKADLYSEVIKRR